MERMKYGRVSTQVWPHLAFEVLIVPPTREEDQITPSRLANMTIKSSKASSFQRAQLFPTDEVTAEWFRR
jgi:hypothetical protein